MKKSISGALSRRRFLGQGAALVGAGGLAAITSSPARAGEPLEVQPWMTSPGAGLSEHGALARHAGDVKRTFIRSQPGTTGSGASRTPLEALEGIITPSALHFERHHSGVPDIDPAKHRLLIHGMVRRPLVFDIDSLKRYPMVSRIHFIECSGNSLQMYSPKPLPLKCGEMHGLVSCSEWTGVPLRILLDEAGIEPGAYWLVAEGADAASVSRSIPIDKAMDDAMVALFQNGESLRPENGFPVRLLLPGYEGNMNIKWLRRIKVVPTPAMTKDETSRYTDLQPNGKALMFTFAMGVKSVITRPSPGLTLKAPGFWEISGLAWSGSGAIRRVEVSSDGGSNWQEAQLSAPVLPRALTRFRMPWRWDGRATVLKSRATDETGAVQPTRDALIGEHGSNVIFHYNAIQAWGVEANGEVKNVYA